MKFSSIFASIACLSGFTTVFATSVRVTYDQGYDDGSRSLSAVACSDGPNGLLTKGFTTQDSLPTFPNIGGALTVGSWNSPNCGTCYALTYNGITIHVLAIDTAANGFNIALEAMDTLTNGNGVNLGVITADYQLVDGSLCGMD